MDQQLTRLTVELGFQGPQTYISPNWYATKSEGGKVVPTWNYAVVHVHATLSAVHELEAVLDILTRLTRRHEIAQPHPWQVADAPTDFTRKLLDNIVGVRLPPAATQTPPLMATSNSPT